MAKQRQQETKNREEVTRHELATLRAIYDQKYSDDIDSGSSLDTVAPNPDKLDGNTGTFFDSDTKQSKKTSKYWDGVYRDAAKTVKKKKGKPSAWGRKNKTAGRHLHVAKPIEYSSPTNQACGLNPFIIPSGAPKIGVPIGTHYVTGEPVSLDPFAYLDAGLISNPGIFVIAQPGVGKSAAVKRLTLGMSGFGIRPLILGDVKPDYPNVIKTIGGQVITLGAGHDKINPLDSGPIHKAAQRLIEKGHRKKADELFEEAATRRLTLTKSICEIARGGQPVTTKESNILRRTLQIFDKDGEYAPTLQDVYQQIQIPTDQLLKAAQATPETYKQKTEYLLDTLLALAEGDLGGLFNTQTTTQIDLDAPGIEIDISRIKTTTSQESLSAAMLAVWSWSFATVDASLALADAGIIEQRRYVAILDELWRSLRGSPTIVDNIDELTRVSRSLAMSNIMVTHGVEDLEALADPASIAKAKGLIERSAIKIIGAVSRKELSKLSDAVGGLSEGEINLLNSWVGGANFTPGMTHPGQGNFLIKLGEAPGIPIHVNLLDRELELYETNRLKL